jgi:hypothetical protein
MAGLSEEVGVLMTKLVQNTHIRTHIHYIYIDYIHIYVYKVNLSLIRPDQALRAPGG